MIFIKKLPKCTNSVIIEITHTQADDLRVKTYATPHATRAPIRAYTRSAHSDQLAQVALTWARMGWSELVGPAFGWGGLALTGARLS